MAREIRSLTGLRGVAALVVVNYHFIQNLAVEPSRLHALALRGYLAVDVFFVLSGFVLALTCGRMFVSGCAVTAYRAFLLRRVARIVPLYAVATAVVLAEIAAANFDLPGWENPAGVILANLLLIQAWSLAPSIVAASWSVSTEVAAYMAFPLLLRLTVFARRGRAVDSLLMASLLLILAAIGGHILGPATNGALDLSDGTTPWPLLRCLGGFMLGLLTFRLAQIERIMTLAANDWCVVAVIAAFGLALWSGLPDLAVYPCLPLIVLIAATDRRLPARLLANRPIHWLGECSYAIYLLHGEVIRHAMRLLRLHLAIDASAMGRVIGGLCIMLVLLSLAAASHRWIEVPARQFLRNQQRDSPPRHKRGAQITPFARSVASASASSPSRSASTASVCSPSNGGGIR
ncbi:MAG: acyltransferase [Acetobacteraceae bacterium]